MTDKYAAIGNPIRYSKSPLIHSTFAQQTNQDISYGLIEGPLEEFRGAVDRFRSEGARGLNITTPFKLDAYNYADELSAGARAAGAVNCMKFEGQKMLADNFDGVGLVRDIVKNLGFPLTGRRVLLLGAGGAARGLVLPFLRESPAQLVIVNRTVSKAEHLAEMFSSYGNVETAGYSDLQQDAFDVVINATSASLRAELPDLCAEAFRPGCLAYELSYAKGLTPFLGLARSAGAGKLADGAGMLVEQAAEAFAWWRGLRPVTRKVIEAITIPLV
jgi:shikimate dehydrogenase